MTKLCFASLNSCFPLTPLNFEKAFNCFILCLNWPYDRGTDKLKPLQVDDPFSGRKKNSKSECSQAEDSDVEAIVKQSQESHSLEDLTKYSW